MNVKPPTEAKILITGAAGFIGSCVATHLFLQGFHQLTLVDDFEALEKKPNLSLLPDVPCIPRVSLPEYLQAEPHFDWVIHLGARTDTTEMDYRVHQLLNLEASKDIWNYCTRLQIPLIYASSAATYGNGELGYNDQHEHTKTYVPLNPYGLSKHQFDLFALEQNQQPPYWYGLKFFNVYGPNEYHKGRMASVVYHAFHQIQKAGELKLFRSHKPDFADGEQRRDFIYVLDILKVTDWLMRTTPESGIYNLGTGKSATFLDLAHALFEALHQTPSIQFIDTPADIRDSYQYFTEADMKKLRLQGYEQPFYSIQSGVADYVRQYLLPGKYFGSV